MAKKLLLLNHGKSSLLNFAVSSFSPPPISNLCKITGMKALVLGFVFCLLAGTVLAQEKASNNTLLWKISGKNLSRPSYLFGTIHMICGDNIQLSDSLKVAIKKNRPRVPGAGYGQPVRDDWCDW
jgi:hypothetical protein